MTRMIVNTDGLNLRSSPAITPNNIILSLSLGQEIEVVNAPEGQRFWEVKIAINGQSKQGFASSRFLRLPLSQPKEKLIQASVKEWARFNRGAGKEHKDPFFRYVGEYWQAIGSNLNGRDRGFPWSAAFISFIVRQTGYSNFKFSASHSRYILDAKTKRSNNNMNAPF